jgi:hypothetical protein
MARRWRGTILATGGVVAFNVLVFASSRPDWHDVQPWVGLAMAVAFVGGALAVFDSWTSAKKRPQQPTESERRNW